MQNLKGLIGNKGEAYAAAVFVTHKDREIPFYTITEEQIDTEQSKLTTARNNYKEELKKLYQHTLDTIGETEAAIFSAYLEITDDDFFFDNCLQRMKKELINIEHILNEEKEQTMQIFLSLDDPYMQERGNDIKNVCNAILDQIIGNTSTINEIATLEKPYILIAEDLTPADTVRLNKAWLKGFITEKGGQTSHTVILAKTLGIPAIVGATDVLSFAQDAKYVLMNGKTGQITFDPNEAMIQEYNERQTLAQKQTALYMQCSNKPAVTLDGRTVSICQNAGQKEDILSFNMEICDGIGLFRTEFLYMEQSSYPDEDVQYELYRLLAEQTQNKETIVRTLDIGGDKKIDYMNIPEESNPFLGYRAIRICLDQTEMFKTQLRAILRASAHGNLAIMFPMIVNYSELVDAKALLAECMEELDSKNIPYKKDIKVGIMIETPAAVLVSDLLAQEADFFSIGTNDLIQYITASDRMNEKTQYLYSICNPAVLRAIKKVTDDAHQAGIKISICGEAASDERLLPVWLSFGIDKLSMVPSQIPLIKYLTTHISGKDADCITETVLKQKDASLIEETLTKYLEQIDAI